MLRAHVKQGYVQDYVVPVSRHAFINIPQLYCEANLYSSYTRSTSSAGNLVRFTDKLDGEMAVGKILRPPFWICPPHEALDPGDLEAAAEA